MRDPQSAGSDHTQFQTLVQSWQKRVLYGLEKVIEGLQWSWSAIGGLGGWWEAWLEEGEVERVTGGGY